MAQLLSSGFSRLFKNRLFWICNILMSAFFILVILMNYRNMKKVPDLYHYTGSTFMFAPLQVIGVFISCFTGMFLGTEYRDGTLRNKVIIGRSRTEIYLSNLIVCFTASLVTSITSILTTFAAGIFFFGAEGIEAVQILKCFGISILMLAAFTGIFTLFSMLIPSRSAGSMINILFFFVLVIAANYILARLDEPQMITTRYTFTIDDELQAAEVISNPEMIPNPYYLEGAARKFYEFFRDLLPTSQGSLLMIQEMEHPVIMALCSLGLMACTTVSGVFHFRRKDLK